MTGELMLLPPVARRSGRRRVGLITSAALHALVALLVVGVSRGPSAAPVSSREAQPRLVWTPPRPPVTVVPVTVTPPPIDYAGARPAGKKATSAASASTPPRESAPGNTTSWREYLPNALALQADGLTAPAYVVTNLTPTLITTLTTRGLAVLVAGHPPFRDAEQVIWQDGRSNGTTTLPEAWGRAVARRGLPLPSAWISGVTLEPGNEVYLVPRPALDASILAAQMSAADTRRVPLDTLTCTYGRLIVESDDVVAFVVDRAIKRGEI